MKTILITGAGGFVGKNLKPFLESKGYKVIAPRSKDFDFSDETIVKNLISQNNPDIFILAGFYGIDTRVPPKDIFEKNLKILNNFVKFSNGKNIFTFGSGAEFDKSKPIIKATDESWAKLPPLDLYGRAKYLLSQEVKHYSNVYNLRLFGVYGPHETDQRFITHAIKCNLTKEPINMRQNVVFSYLYIVDLCKIILAFIEKTPKHKFINLVPDEEIDLITISNIVNSISDIKSDIIIGKEGLANEYTGDNILLKKELPNFVFTSYKEGISAFYSYLKANN